MLPWTTLALAASDPVPAALLAEGGTEAWDELVELCDDIGPRLSGSTGLDRAIEWAAGRMEADGLRVEKQPVQIPHWVRGEESARILAPVDERLEVLGLGMTVATPGGAVEAPVVAARSWEELTALGDRVKGSIVLLDPPWAGYGETVGYRWAGPDRAAAMGAVGVLLRSVTDRSLSTPHTGTLGYDGDVRIPAAAVSHEAADRIRRWVDRGREVRVRMSLGGELKPDAPSANVVGEVKGRKKPDEVVVLGCHLDSWDVGTGAQDDGAACVAVMEAVARIGALPKPPKRTVRAVLFTNEENGLAGGKAYAEANGELTQVALIESDTGMGGVLGFTVDPGGDAEDEAAAKARGEALLPGVRALLAPLGSLGVKTFEVGHAGADVGPTLRAKGGLGLGVLHDMTDYWSIHHTHADTLDKIDPAELDREVRILAGLAWILAEADPLPGASK